MRTLAAAMLVATAALPSTAAVFLSEPTAIRNGWSTVPVLTRGESVPLIGGTAGQTFAWTSEDCLFDGLGATRIDDHTLQVYINFESWPGRIGRVRIDRDALRGWIAGRVVGNTNTNQVPAPAGLVKGMAVGWNTVDSGDGSLVRPCSGNLWEPHAFGYGRGFNDRLYLSGE